MLLTIISLITVAIDECLPPSPSSIIIKRITELAAIALFVVRHAIIHCLVAHVAELLAALVALDQVAVTLLLVDSLALLDGANAAQLDVDPLYVLAGAIRLDLLWCYLVGKQRALVAVMIRLLLVMLLSFSRGAAVPAEVLEAARALNLCAAGRVLADWHAAFRVRARLRIELDEQFRQNVGGRLVVFQDLVHLLLSYITKVLH